MARDNVAHPQQNNRKGKDCTQPEPPAHITELIVWFLLGADRVRFQHLDVSEGLPDQYDIITTFDVVHDAIDPRRLLRAIREGLRPGGRYVCMEANGSDKLEENVGLAGSLFYGISVLYCMTTSLARHGEGLGTLGLPETTLRELCAEAGFSDVRRVPIEIPFNNLYEITP